MIEEIYNCQTCRNYAKSIAKDNHEEVFSLAIEKIINQNPQKVENFKSYFYIVLKSVYMDYLKSNNNLVFIDEYFNEEEEIEENNYKLALELFLSKETKDEELIFYQDLIYLSLENSKSSLCAKLNLRRADLDVYLNQAYKLIKNEYNLLTN